MGTARKDQSRSKKLFFAAQHIHISRNNATYRRLLESLTNIAYCIAHHSAIVVKYWEIRRLCVVN